jgi:superoxide dismutase, Fe-Mn family
MNHVLIDLPYAAEALSPHYSQETVQFHHGKHHRAYVTKLNELIKGTEFEDGSLESVVKKSSGALFNNASQVWNHNFFWNCMAPGGGGKPDGTLGKAIDEKWKNYESFSKAFTSSAVNNFGSGWSWLVKKSDGSVDIVNTSDAGSLLTTKDKPLLTVDVWEHAYYIDYRNERQKYVEAFLGHLVNWSFAQANFDKA